MALKQANTLAPSNVSASGFALADARHIGGHRVVASLADRATKYPVDYMAWVYLALMRYLSG